MLFRGSIALLTAGGLLLGLNTAAAADVVTTGSDDPEVSALPDSSTLQTPVVSKGRVIRTDGNPAAGAELILLAWPSNDVVGKHVAGDTAKLQPVAKATAGSDGEFEIRIANNSALEPLAGRDGIVNMMLTAESGADAVLPFSFPRQLNVMHAPNGDRELILSKVNLEGADVTVAEPVNVQLAMDGAATEEGTPAGEPVPETTSTVVEQEPRVTPTQKYWQIELVADYGPRWNLVGQHWSINTAVLTQFHFLSNSKSEIGVGISATGAYGSFKRNGTVAKSTDSNLSFAATGAHMKRFHDTSFRLGKYRYTEWSTMGHIIKRYYIVKPLNWSGGARSRALTWTPHAPYCSLPFGPRTEWSKSKTRAVTWSNGYEVAKVIGVELSTVSGYTSTAKIDYKFGGTRRVCGEKGPFDGNAERLVSR